MASSSLEPGMSFRVFLSFNHQDVRRNFIGHLCAALDQTGIFTYNDVDNEDSSMGEIAGSIVQAIEESRIVISVLSENYASSSWSLKELVKIMECKVRKNLIVLPVFYKVAPADVRLDRGDSKMAVAKHESRYDRETVERWKMALRRTGDLLGWALGYESSEAALIKDIVRTITEMIRFDVYLSFRGKDVCESFVESLNEALIRRGINTFMDAEKLRMGHDCSPVPIDAIEHSRMYIVVFSENYAESWSCLKELVQILERKNRRKQPMLPIFYKVEPWVVRAQKKSYEVALDEREKEHGIRKVKKWKEALSEAADLNGVPLHDGNEDDWIPRTVEKIVKMMEEIRRKVE